MAATPACHGCATAVRRRRRCASAFIRPWRRCICQPTALLLRVVRRLLSGAIAGRSSVVGRRSSVIAAARRLAQFGRRRRFVFLVPAEMGLRLSLAVNIVRRPASAARQKIFVLPPHRPPSFCFLRSARRRILLSLVFLNHSVPLTKRSCPRALSPLTVNFPSPPVRPPCPWLAVASGS